MAPLYRQIADRYLDAIRSGALASGSRFPSVRRLMGEHQVSMSTALSVCRQLEADGWLEARPRSGYYVHRPARMGMAPVTEPAREARPAPPDYVGIHARVSSILARAETATITVDFAKAVAAPDAYPVDALSRLMQRQLRLRPQILSTMTRRHAHPQLRQALAEHAVSRGAALRPDEIVVTHGCTEAVNLALRAVTRPGDTVAVESPTFYGLLQILESLGLRALEIPTSPTTGLSLEALQFALEHHAPIDGDADPGRAPDAAAAAPSLIPSPTSVPSPSSAPSPSPVPSPSTAPPPSSAPPSPSRIRALVTMPTLHNPLGCSMPDPRKARLVALCARHGVAIIEDDIYGEMTATGEGGASPRILKSFDDGDTVIHCSSLNKSLAPGLRLGWMAAGRWQDRVEMLKYSQSRFSEELAQVAAAQFMLSPGWPRHLHRLRERLARQRLAMADAVSAHFPAGTRLSLPDGGLLLWLQLPPPIDGHALFERALEHGIKLLPGAMFSNAARFDAFVRLSCGQAWSPTVDEALRTLGRIAHELA
ncbi:MAG: PLP-dependent aminotransferase family protein [Burkholderiaceae bacterium]